MSLADVSRAVYRLVAVYGQLFGADGDSQKTMIIEWLKALSDLTPRALDQAVTDWIATECKWPKPAELREKASHKASMQAAAVSRNKRIHPRRLQPTPEMLTFGFMKSKLRANSQWDDFLDTIHPTAEHNYFVEAVFNGSSTALAVPNPSRADCIRQNFGEQLLKHFGSPISVTVDLFATFDRLPSAD